MSSSTEQITNLSTEEKRALLARLLQKKRNEPKTAPVSLPPARRRLWSFNVPIINLMDRVISDARIQAYLKSLGGFDGLLDQEELAFVLRLSARRQADDRVLRPHL